MHSTENVGLQLQNRFGAIEVKASSKDGGVQNQVNLNDLAYTLQYGRKSFDHRLAIAAKTQEELIERLACFTDGKRLDAIATGQVKGDGAKDAFGGQKFHWHVVRPLGASSSGASNPPAPAYPGY